MNVILAQIDVIDYILAFLADDGNSVVQFALSSKEMYDRIIRQESSDPNLWKNLIRHRWKRTIRRPKALGRVWDEDGNLQEDLTMPISYRDLYIEKRRADAEAIRRLEQMASALQNVLKLNESQRMVTYRNSHIGQTWEHLEWNFLFRNRADCYDVLKSMARRHFGNLPSSIRDRLLAFLGTRCVQDFHFADCLLEWKRLMESGSEEPRSPTHASQLKAAHRLEKFVFLVCEIQKTPCEILQDHTFQSYSNAMLGENDSELDQESAKISIAKKSLDEIAKVCKDRIDEELGTSASVTKKLRVVNDVLVNRYGFSGNVKDYYNYRNVLLDHVLESKAGMPLTLCILYCCICRRLGIPVQVTGLPGHIVLGFDTNDEINTTTERRAFIDVFNGCRFLSRDHCRQIVESYGIGWREDFLEPLSTKMNLQRIFNNLRNCHEKAMGQSDPPFFCSELMFQQHTLGMVHRYPPEIACTMLERLAQDISIVLSPDLLRIYKLLSPRGMERDPVANAAQARALLELSSYVGLSYHNYA